MIDVEKIHNTLMGLKQDSFNLLYNEIKDNYWSIFNIEDFVSYFNDKMWWKYEYSLYADFLSYYFDREDEK